MTAQELSYNGAPLTVRGDEAAAHRKTREHISRPGTWWTGAERVAIAADTRIADATGIPLDESGRDAREALASRLDVQRYEE